MATNILIADDSQTMRRVIRRTLEISALDVGEIYEAPDGKSALDVLDSHAVDVVLLDINMPVMDGVEFIHRVRANVALRGVAIIVISAEANESRVAEMTAAGARGFIRKPFFPEQIRRAIAPLMRAEPQVTAGGGELSF